MMLVASLMLAATFALPLAQADVPSEGWCYPLTQPVVVDGDLEEWDRRGPIRIDRPDQRDLREGGVLSRAWGGPEDCSGTFYFAYDEQYLYLAGEIRDDDRVAHNQIWFNGDCVELFLDTSPDTDPGSFEFDDAAFQLCLMPYNPARAWGVLKRGSRNLLSDGDFHGVRVASRPTEDAGYTFESRWPFDNFPELDPSSGGLGFNIALNDHDQVEDGRQSYLTVNGRGYNYLTTENFLPLSVVAPEGALLGRDEEAVVSRGWLGWFLAVAAALLLIVGVLFGSRPLYTFIDQRLRSWRRLGLIVIGTVLLAVYGVPWAIAWLQESNARDEFAARAAAASAVIADFSEGIALHEGRGLDEPDAMLRLLRGDVVQIRPDYRYEPLDLRGAESDPDRRLSDEEVPVKEFGFPLSSARTHYFPLARPVPLSRLYVFGSSRVAGGGIAGNAPGVRDPAIEIGVRLADGGVYTEMFPAIDHTLIEGGSRPISGRFGPGWESQGSVVDSYFLGKAALDDRPVQAVMIAVHDASVSFRLHGVTVADSQDDELVPLNLSRPSEAGPPAPLWDGFPRNAGIPLAGGGRAASHTVQVGREVDALWFFYSTRDAEVLEPALAGIEVARITAHAADGEATVMPVRAGVHLTYGLADPSKRPADMDSLPAFNWSSSGGIERIEVLEMAFPESSEIETVDVENLGQLSGLRLFAVTAGTLARAGQIPSSSSLVRTSRERVRIKTELADSLEGLGFLVASAGRVTAVDFPDLELNESLVGARYPLGGADEEMPDTAYRAPLGNEEYLVRSFSFATDTGPDLIVAAAYPIEGMASLERIRDQASAVALLLILPFLLFHVLDGTSRAASMRVRLTALLVATSLIPIVLLFAVLYNVVAKDRARLRESRATAAMQQVGTRLDRMFLQTQRAAREILEGEVVRAVRSTGVLDKERVEAYLEEVISLRPVPGLELAARLDVELPDGERYRFHDRPGGDAASRFDELPPGIHHHWDRLVIVATQKRVETAGQVSVTLAGDLRRDLIEELSSGTGARVSLLTMKGFPLAGSADGNAERRASDVEQIRRQNTHSFRSASSGELVATGLLAVSGGGDPAGLIEVVLPGDSFQLALLFGELPLKTFFFWFCVVGLLFAVFMGSVATWRITGPIETLQSAAHQVALGDLNALVRVPGRGEVARLARTFNAMVTELKARAAERQRTDSALSRLSARMDLEHTAEELVTVLCEEPTATLGVLYRRDSDLDRLVRTGRHVGSVSAPPSELKIVGPFASVMTSSEPMILPAASPSNETEGESLDAGAAAIIGQGLALLVPLWVSDRAVGLVLMKYGPAVFRSEVEAAAPLLKQLASSGAAALENARLYQMAVVDPQTGLHVESYFHNRLAEEVDRAVARDAQVSVVRIAVEGLERVLPTRRAEAVREALTRVAASARAVSRDMYLIARSEAGLWLLLPETSVGAANQVVARLDLSVVATVPTRDGRSLATYVGVASFPEDGRSSAQLIDAAERNLAAARRKHVERALRPAPSADPAEGLDLHPFVFQSLVMRSLLSQVARVAPSRAPILLLGETGVGKEVVAELVHRFSDRPHRPFVALNCSALPEALLEAELFGYEKGAFTGAHRSKPGQLEVADGGTLFLDEVGDMPTSVQSKLLRVLQDHRFVRLGGQKPVQTNVRLVSATNRDLQELIAAGSFRADLYYRLKGVEFRIAALRERREEIPDLVDRFVTEFSRDRQRPISFSTAALDELYRYDWPGNVRELRAVVQRAILLSDGDLVLPGALEFRAGQGGSSASPSPNQRRSSASNVPSRESSRPPGRPGQSPSSSVEGSADDLNERQRRFLSGLVAGRLFRSREYFEEVGVSPRTGLRDLSDLMDKGHLVRLGRRRAAVYKRST